jgi:hypothetical protein
VSLPGRAARIAAEADPIGWTRRSTAPVRRQRSSTGCDQSARAP